MGLAYFVFGVIAGMVLLVILPLFIALVGVLLAIGVVIALPLILAILILLGIVAAAPALGYGLLLAAILIALWASDRKRRPRDKPLSL
jgi:hypothetical protein